MPAILIDINLVWQIINFCVIMFIFKKKGLVLNGANPVYLYGYGGFSINMTPEFRASYIALLEQANMALDEVLNGIELGMPVDLLQIDMTRSWDLLGEIIGDSIQDELITQLFSQFCLGK